MNNRLKSWFSLGFLGLIFGLSACAQINNDKPKSMTMPVSDINHSARIFLTTPDKTNLLSDKSKIDFSNSASSNNIIEVDEAKTYQEFIGAGAAISDASAYLFQNKLSADNRQKILNELFGNDGLNFGYTRITLGASDFSPNHYSYNDMPAGKTDINLDNFSIAPAKADLIPVLKSMVAINPSLKIMVSPWSAPGWMKTTDSLIGGSLKPEYYDVYSKYFIRFIKELKKENINISSLTIQNEPHFTPNNYPGMRFDDAERANFIKGHLGPMLAKESLNVDIYEWDHNWDEPNAPLNVLKDEDANKYIKGVAWHCYGGKSTAQTQVHDAFPNKEAIFTECSGGEWDKDWNKAFVWQVKNLIIGTTRNWASGVMLWNIALDEKFGPHLGGCSNCRGVITIDSKDGSITRNMEYYALGHLSKFIQKGAKRIDSSERINGIENVAFKNPDNTIAMIILNDSSESQNISIKSKFGILNYQLPKGAAATIVW